MKSQEIIARVEFLADEESGEEFIYECINSDFDCGRRIDWQKIVVKARNKYDLWLFINKFLLDETNGEFCYVEKLIKTMSKSTTIDETINFDFISWEEKILHVYGYSFRFVKRPVITHSKRLLQEKLLEIVEQMRQTNCPLPDELQLVYCVTKTWDREGTAIHIDPHLTKEQAKDACGEEQEWEGKYGAQVKCQVVEPNSDFIKKSQGAYHF